MESGKWFLSLENMFGKRADQENREEHFAALARRFALDAKMFRCRAAVHVENKDDIVFWSTVLRHFRPDDRFHFIAGSRNEYGHETSGVTQCLKYYRSLNPGFFICIDSDYRYLLHERGIDAGHFVLQTYTYSFENHHCFADGLNEVCSRVAHVPNRIFNFRWFLATYSRIIYELFIWHLYFLNSDPSRFTKFEFNKYINLNAIKPQVSVKDNGARALEELQMKVERKINYLNRHYSRANLEQVKEKYKKLGLVPETTYLFLRGHNVYDMISCLCKEVCKALLKREQRHRNTRNAIAALYQARNNVDTLLRQNICYGDYLAIRKLEEDIHRLLD